MLSLRVAQINSATNPAAGSQDFIVELVGGGHSKTTFASTFGALPKPYDHVGWCTPPLQNVMTTIRIPLHSFIMNNSAQGEIYVDDIEFSR